MLFFLIIPLLLEIEMKALYQHNTISAVRNTNQTLKTRKKKAEIGELIWGEN